VRQTGIVFVRWRELDCTLAEVEEDSAFRALCPELIVVIQSLDVVVIPGFGRLENILTRQINSRE
jgi:hypothetical protein